jgi:hypothetical protein
MGEEAVERHGELGTPLLEASPSAPAKHAGGEHEPDEGNAGCEPREAAGPCRQALGKAALRI